MLRLAWLVVVAGCGRIGFDSAATRLDGSSPDDGPDVLVPQGLIAWYPFEDLDPATPPSRTSDATGLGHPLECAVNQCPTLVAGKQGLGTQWDGAVRGLQTIGPTTALQTPTGYTITAWFQMISLPPAEMCIVTMARGAGTSNSWAACVQPSGVVFFASSVVYVFSSPVSAGGWHHVALRWDGSTNTLLIDGTVSGSAAAATTTFDGSPITVGADSDSGTLSGAFSGLIDDVRIYNRPLDPGELQLLAAP